MVPESIDVGFSIRPVSTATPFLAPPYPALTMSTHHYLGTMKTSILILAGILLAPVAKPQSIVTTYDGHPGSRNVRVIHYDDRFLFLSRDYGDHRDAHGNTSPGFFIHSKVKGRWLQILQVSTKDGKFGKSYSNDRGKMKPLIMAPVMWDFTAYADKPWIDLPIKTSGFITFPDRIEFDEKSDRYKLSFHTDWKIESVATVLYINRKDLNEQFDKFAPEPQ